MYDSWNRITQISYPGAEILNYYYNSGGNLYCITNNNSYAYLARSDYNYFGELTYQKYGNNTETVYTYTDKLRRLNSINVKNSSSQLLMNPVYTYDYIGNITGINNQGTTIGSFSMTTAHYDLYNRLISASGSFVDPLSHNSSSYNLNGVVYGNSGEILEKNQSHILQGNSNALNSYNNIYDYVSSTHKISQIKEQSSGKTEQFSYDLNGNISQRVTPTITCNYGWDEENRLRSFTKKNKLGETTHLYYYDASGERIIKVKGTTAKLFQDADLSSSQLLLRDFTIYPSAFITQSDTKVTKHYYAGTKRIASRIEMKTAFEPGISIDTELKLKQETDLEAIAKTLDCKEYKYEFNQYEAETDDEDTVTLRAEVPTPVFYYHPDHLGTSTVISNSAGAVHQYFFNLPFGEPNPLRRSRMSSPTPINSIMRGQTMIEGCTNSTYELNYKFNAKELDAESGLYYYGARYYDPRISVWMSVDPMWEKYKHYSPFNYCANNPFIYVDPDGKDIYRYDEKSGRNILYKKTKDNYDQIGKFKYNKSSGQYELKTRKNGEAKTFINKIEKGILSDGINFKTQDQIINVGGVNQPTIEGVEKFILSFSNYINKELSGFYLSNKGENKTSYVYFSKYEKNTDTRAYSYFRLDRTNPELINQVIPNTAFHTHLSKFEDSYRFKASNADLDAKNSELQNGIKKFLIITYPKNIEY